MSQGVTESARKWGATHVAQGFPAVTDSAGTRSADAAPPRLQFRVSVDARHPLYGALVALPPGQRGTALLVMAERASCVSPPSPDGAPPSSPDGMPSAPAGVARSLERIAGALEHLAAGGTPLETRSTVSADDASERAARLGEAFDA